MPALSLKATLRASTPRGLTPLWERLETSPLGYRLARGTFWSLAGALISRGLALLSSIIVARMLGKAGFGELGIIQSSVGMFGTFAGFGLGVTATKYVAEFRAKDPVRAGRIIRLSSLVSWATGGAMALLLFFLAPWLAAHTLAAPHLDGLLRIGSLLLLLGAINGSQTGALAGFESFKRIAWINFIAGIAAFPLMVGGARWRGLEGALLGLVASQALNCWLNFHGLRAEARRAGVPIVFAGASREWNVLWKFSLPALLSGVMVVPANWICNAIIVNQPGGYGEMGLFNAANQWRQAILFLPGLLTSVVLPMLSSLQGPAEAHNYQKVLKVNLVLSILSSVTLALPCALLATWIMASYGADFLSGGNVLVLLCIVSVIIAVLSVVGQTIASDGKMWFGFALNSVWAIIMLGSCWLLRKRGATGLAFANLAAYGFHVITVSAYVYCRRHSIYRKKPMTSSLR